MIHLLIFLVIAAFYSWLYAIAAGIVEAISIVPFFGKGSEGFAKSLNTRPRLFFFVLILKNVVLGIANAIMIFWITASYLEKYNGNFWLYAVISFFWSLLIIGRYNAFPTMFFFSSTVTLVLFWLGFGAFAWIITGILTFITSIAYYFGKIDYIKNNALYGKYENM